MRTEEVLEQIDITRDKLYYLERKGYVRPKKVPKGELEGYEWSQEDLERIRVIWKYLKEGFRHKIAYQKAMAELEQN